ncbi:MAG: LPP20 family lipoprotein [Halorhodospira halophila]|uniref:LPP20 family lipoprotein n=1 Tax=Halorhodospira TaxID=85108 RepID=UPI0019143C1C|nr:LPP20 family lipoprotein [Halorhodospira halophila]MCC3749818.1 LPP20 family lipoprotein [Halorhodospira halophila]MCG5527734.1 LPP20 family lipoprotein [Halorhodospira halophila]MCG5532730.1 LPP20 family lipoprotein [Halorhodospira sp. 9621]MCG5542396.1 LPP20 family lipoprotein [Halorhodospira sp. 9628]
MKALLVVLMALFLLAGCAGSAPPSGDQPSWVVGGEPASYPRESYLSAVGTADHRELAHDRARAELARAFEVHVTAATQQEDRLAFGDGETRHRATLGQQVATRTAVTLRGVEIGETWREPQSGRYHVLAVMDRQQAASALREGIAGLDAATSRYLRQADAAADPLHALAALARGLEAQRQRAEYQQALRVLTGAGMTVRYELAVLRARLAAEAGSIPFGIGARGDHAERVASKLRASVAAAGFRVDEREDAYRLEAVLELEDLGQRDGWYWQRGGLTLRLLDDAGEVRGEQRWPVRGAATDYTTAERRALEQAFERLGEDLFGLIIALAVGQGESAPRG